MELSNRVKYRLMLVNDVVLGVFALLSIVPIMMSPMLFDAPGSEGRLGILILFYAMLSYPCVYVLSLFTQLFFGLVRKKITTALMVSYLPLVPLIAMVFASLIM